MGWLRLDDQFDDHPKTVAAGHEASWLDVRGMLFCARHETDGHIPLAQIPRIASDFSPAKRRKLISRLVEVGRWREVEDGFVVHDFLDYNPASTKKEAEREAARERMRKARENKGKRSGEQTPNERANTEGSSDNPDPTPPGTTPPTPPQVGGRTKSLRSNGTNPRSLALKREMDALQREVQDCPECGDAAWTCTRCAHKLRQLEAVS